MGKIYRIPIPKAIRLIKFSNRRYVLLFGIACIFITLIVGNLVPSGTAGVASRILTYGLVFLFVAGLFWEDWSRLTTRVIVVISIVFILACIGFATKRVYDVHNPVYVTQTLFNESYTYIDSIWSKPVSISKADYEATLLDKPTRFVLDLAPFLVPILVFLLAARGAIKEEYRSEP